MLAGRMSDFQFQDMLPLGADDTPYRKLTSDFVSTFPQVKVLL